MDPPTMSETRDDEEQNVKYFETIELLLAAGYFRARIKGLSPFDKVVGGMTWCITTCDFDVDVDLLFQENSTIGQKIALTEKIVAVLPSMRCPHRIEPHQIQGLDFISIFPVIQWLVKRAIETREETGDQIRSYSITQFHKNYSFPEDLEYENRKEKCLEAVLKCKDSYKPRRIYRKPSSLLRTDEETQVQSTLLEYGRRYGFSKSSKTEKEQTARQKALAASMTKAGSAEEDDHQKEEMRIKTIMEGMSEAGIKEMLSSRTVGSLVGLQSEKIVEISAAYAQQQAKLEQETTELKAGRQAGAQTYTRLVATLEKSIANEKAKLQEAAIELQSVTEALNSTKDEHEKKVQERQRLDEQMVGLDSLETEKNKSLLGQLRSLVALNESLKKQELEFKAQCKDELAILQDKLNAVKSGNASEDSDEAMRVKLIVDQFDRDSEKLQKIRLLLAKKNREIASLQWKIDDVPSRAELAQYQRRFIELYNQVASTHKETKQFYTLYNTLDDTKLYLEKEVGLLNSIHDSFEQALSSSTSKEEFLQQLEKIVQGVLNNKSNVDKRRNQEKAKRDTLNSRLMDLVEKQRMYFKTVREFQEECKKSEMIQSKSRTE